MKNKRFVSIDFLKGIAIILMIFIHILMCLVIESEKGLIFSFINFMAKIAAPLFLFLVGVNIIFLKNEKNKGSDYILFKRAIFLIIIGLLIKFIWNPDILHFIGFFMLFSIVILRLNIYLKSFILIIVLFVSKILLYYFNYYSNWVHIPYVYIDFWSFFGFIKSLFFNGVYAFFPWFFFVLIGIIYGEFLIDSINKKKFSLFFYYSLGLGLGFYFLSLITRYIFLIGFSFYPASISYIFMMSGVCIIFLSLLFVFFDENKYSNNFVKFFSFIGLFSLSFYVLHILVGILYFYLLNTFFSFSFIFSFIYAFFVFFVSFIIIYLFFKWFDNGVFEYVIRKVS